MVRKSILKFFFILLAPCLLLTSCKVSSISGSLTPVSELPISDPTPDPPADVAVSCPDGPTNFVTNMNAKYVIGQPDFTSNAENQGGTPSEYTMGKPIGVFVKDNKIYVGDATNNRVLIYDGIPTSNGVAANEVVGQPNFTDNTARTSAVGFSGVQGVSVSDTHLIVGEWTNSRVTMWPLSDLSSAEYAIGQPDLDSSTTNNGGIGPATLDRVARAVQAGTKLIIADVGNRRVLIYDLLMLNTGMSASVVIGQDDYVSTGSGTAKNQMGNPLGISTDGTSLVILDNGNDRILIYNTIPTTDGVAADVEVGGYGQGLNQLNNPVGVFYGSGKLFVADRGNDRVLIWNSLPTVDNQNADVVLGQNGPGSSAHNQCSCSTAAANTMWGVHMVYYNGCNLFATDLSNNRVLVY